MKYEISEMKNNYRNEIRNDWNETYVAEMEHAGFPGFCTNEGQGT